jgi:peptide/nickel transport system ATP-binding protein
VAVVTVSGLSIQLRHESVEIVEGVSFELAPGEICGLVGESGAGKSTIGTALLGEARPGTRLSAGSVVIDGVELRGLRDTELRALRGKVISYIPQDPSASLNPALRVEAQLGELISVHEPEVPAKTRRERMRKALRDVHLPDDDDLLSRYPHQLSGGQLQRVAIAMAFILEPRVIVLDEPTTGLDVVTQAHVLRTVRTLCRERSVAALYVTHDLAVLSGLADRVIVLYAGQIVESGRAEVVFRDPAHPYTRRLLASIPDPALARHLEGIPGRPPSPHERSANRCMFAPRCDYALPACHSEAPQVMSLEESHLVRCIRARELERAPVSSRPASLPVTSSDVAVLSIDRLSAWHGASQTLSDVSFSLAGSECVALVGESGSGKTTLSRAIVGLHAHREGEITFRGEQLAARARSRPAVVRQRIQYIFQSPYASLNPRRTIGDSIADPIRFFFGVSGAEARRRTAEALERVSLSARMADLRPSALSGGERQRAAIARALVCEPAVLVCDEVTSALDVSVQATIVELLSTLQAEIGVALLFVTHNIALVRTIAHRVVVLDRGVVVETGSTEQVLTMPAEPATQALLEHTPALPT